MFFLMFFAKDIKLFKSDYCCWKLCFKLKSFQISYKLLAWYFKLISAKRFFIYSKVALFLISKILTFFNQFLLQLSRSKTGSSVIWYFIHIVFSKYFDLISIYCDVFSNKSLSDQNENISTKRLFVIIFLHYCKSLSLIVYLH